tara:strand:- start:424 stop:738 length:315 start_codon:yes stop_codon:yes gene_type:complete
MEDIKYTEDKTKHILELYKKSRIRDKAKYQQNKLKEGFNEKNRERANAHYKANKEIKTTKYKDNRDVLNAKSLYNYYNRNDKVELFKTKHVNKYNLLITQGLLS